ncbi:unnamed protein product [Camellia sinensis]
MLLCPCCYCIGVVFFFIFSFFPWLLLIGLSSFVAFCLVVCFCQSLCSCHSLWVVKHYIYNTNNVYNNLVVVAAATGLLLVLGLLLVFWAATRSKSSGTRAPSAASMAQRACSISKLQKNKDKTDHWAVTI